MTKPPDSSRLVAVVPAAGQGSRFGLAAPDQPKQYFSVAGKTVLEHTIQALLGLPGLERIAVGLSADDSFFSQLQVAGEPRVCSFQGGRERADTVLAGLDMLADTEPDWVFVHDAARPCIDQRDLQRLLASIGSAPDGLVLGRPVSDTVKQVDSDRAIEKTLDRSCLWAAETPQCFPFGLLRDALRRCQDSDMKVTDEASAMEHCGYRPRMLPAEFPNPKLTLPADAPWVEHLLTR